MQSRTINLSLFMSYMLAGALAGLVIIHPLVLTIMWLEFAAENPQVPGYIDFMRSRVWLIFIPKQLSMALAFAGLGAVIGVVFGVFTRSYLRRTKALRFLEAAIGRTIPELIKAGESDSVEFKSSVRWDVKEAHINRGLEKVIGKTIAGFFNTRGGNLLIGVADDGEILGLQNDYSTLRRQNRDGFEVAINDIVKKMLGGDLCPLIHLSFAEIDARDVCLVAIEPSPRAVYLEEGHGSAFFVRSGNSTRQLDVREALSFAKTRWAG